MLSQKRTLLKCWLLLALCVLAPGAAHAKKKRSAVLPARMARSMAPAPAPAVAMSARRLLDDGDAPAEAEPKPSAQVAATETQPAAPVTQQPAEPQQPAATQQQPAGAQPPAEATEPAEPVVEAPAPAPSGGEEPPDPNAPGKAWAQCGGTAPSADANQTWAGSKTCVQNATCVYLSPSFSQCIPVEQSRGYGCSAPYAQCGGTDNGVITAWSGPYCCTEGNECVFFSSSYSQCKPCNGVYEQWCVTMCRHCETATSTEKTNTPPSGGTIPGTDVPWQGHGRASCCAAGSSCRYVNTNYYQCKPNNV